MRSWKGARFNGWLLLSLPNLPSPEYLMILIFFLWIFVSYRAKMGKIKRSVVETTLCPALGKGTGASLGSKIVSASRGLTWAGKENAVLPQTAAMPTCLWGTENRFFPLWVRLCLPTRMVYVCIHPSVPCYGVFNLLATLGWTWWRRRGLQCCSAFLHSEGHKHQWLILGIHAHN